MSAPDHWDDEAPRFDTDDAAIDAFLAGADYGVAPGLQLEGQALAARVGLPPYWAVLARIEAGVYLLRADPPPSAEEGQRLRQVKAALATAGLSQVELEEPAFTRVAGMIVVGARIADWELWAADHERARECLRQTLMGDASAQPLGTGDAAPGMTLDELLGQHEGLRDLDRQLDELADRMRRNGDDGADDDGAAGGPAR